MKTKEIKYPEVSHILMCEDFNEGEVAKIVRAYKKALNILNNKQPQEDGA